METSTVENIKKTSYFVVNDDVVIADCPNHEIAVNVISSLVLAHQQYRVIVGAIKGKGIYVFGGCSTIAESDSDIRAIAAVKNYLSSTQ